MPACGEKGGRDRIVGILPVLGKRSLSNVCQCAPGQRRQSERNVSLFTSFLRCLTRMCRHRPMSRPYLFSSPIRSEERLSLPDTRVSVVVTSPLSHGPSTRTSTTLNPVFRASAGTAKACLSNQGTSARVPRDDRDVIVVAALLGAETTPPAVASVVVAHVETVAVLLYTPFYSSARAYLPRDAAPTVSDRWFLTHGVVISINKRILAVPPLRLAATQISTAVASHARRHTPGLRSEQRSHAEGRCWPKHWLRL